jgi:hypothetical protein
MKRLLVLLVFVSFAKTNFAQLYQAFPTDSAVWRQSSANFNYPDWYQRDYKYYIQGDTLFSGNTYHKIFKTVISSYYIMGSNPTFELRSGPTMTDTNKYVGAIREDLSKHVYFLPDTITTTSEILLYDFNLNVGDTLPYSYNNSSYFLGLNYVSGIDSVLVGTQYHKRFKISASGYTNYVSIIEGVGSAFGLLEMFIDPFEWSDFLICYSYNGQSVWTDSIGHPPTYTPDCSLPALAGINEQSQKNQISIFPNPTTGIITIKTHISEKTSIIITDILGKTTYQAAFSSAEKVIDLSQFPRGVYFLKATDSNKISSIQKIVLQ